MFRKPLVLFSLFLMMIVLSNFPDGIAPDFFKVEETGGNMIKDLDLNMKSGEMVFSFLELPSGESTLIQNYDGQTVLINTGSVTSKRMFRQQLSVFGVKEIDALIFTNIGKQYTGNLPWLLEHVTIDRILIADRSLSEFANQFNIQKEKITPLQNGDKVVPLNGLSLKVLDVNEGGLTFTTNFAKHTFLYMGVASKEADEAIITHQIGGVELLKVGGFGHDSGTSEQLLNNVDPEIAVIFKKEGHKVSEGVTRRLEEHWTEIFQPYKQGIIMVKCNNTDYKITTVPLITQDLAVRQYHFYAMLEKIRPIIENEGHSTKKY